MKPASQEPNGKYMNAAGEPTYNIKDDGTIDWFTYSGFRMYHAECHVCHGPEGEGSSYAPRLVDSLKRLDYAQFQEVVTNGRQVNNAAQHSVMPAFGTNANVMCYIDDLYLYLKARADGVLPRGPSAEERTQERRGARRREAVPRRHELKVSMVSGSMRQLAALAAAFLLAGAHAPAFSQSTGLGASVELVDEEVLRVCADPHNLPFSDEKEEGFEQALAKLLAPKLGRKSVSFTYFPQATGFVRMTLAARKCDVIMGYPQGDELVQNTNHYYRTAYALVFKPGKGLDGLATIEDPRLKDKKIGLVAGTPPSTNVAAAGLMGNVKPYQ